MDTDLDLVTKIKTDQDSDAIKELINRHTGIYFSVVQKYAATYPQIVRLDDMKDDKVFNIYQFVLDFDPAKNTKVSSYIHDRTDLLCNSLLKDDSRPYHIPVRQTDYLDAVPENGIQTVLPDTTEAADVEAMADKDLSLEAILEDASLIKDKRFVAILKWRHFVTPTLTWRQIGVKLGVTHERARQIYNENIVRVKRHLQESHT